MDKKRILIVGDDVALTHAVKLNLEDMGDYDVRVENRSSLAMLAARQFRPDLILLDYIMPGQDGGDVSVQLRDDPELKKVPLIMVTALMSNGETAGADYIRRGGQVMVAKPVRFDKLLRCIELGLAGKL